MTGARPTEPEPLPKKEIYIWRYLLMACLFRNEKVNQKLVESGQDLRRVARSVFCKDR